MSEERILSDIVWTPERGIAEPEVRGIAWNNFLLSDGMYDGKWRTDAGIRITPDTALQSTVVLACCRILAETIGSLPIHIYRRTPNGGREIASEIPLYKVLTFAPNSWQTKYEFFEQLVMTICLWGNSYTRIKSGRYGSVSELDNLHPSNMDVERLENGRLRYSYTNPETGRIERYTQDQIMHCRWTPEPDGIKGMVPVEVGREAIALARACEIHASKFWANSARPGIVLQTEGTISAEAAQQLRENWNRIHRGVESAYQTAILTNGLKATEIGFTNEASQFNASRAFQSEEIARIYRLPLHLVQGQSGGNLEVAGQEFVTYTLVPWLRRIESAISRSLIYNDDVFFAEFDVRGLLRGDSNSRASYYSTMISLGIYSINDCRRLENLPPLGPDGDHHFVAMNVQTLADAVKPKPDPMAAMMGGGGPPPAVPKGVPSLPGVKTGEAPPESVKGEASEKKPQVEDAVEVEEGRSADCGRQEGGKFGPKNDCAKGDGESAKDRDKRVRGEAKSLPAEISASSAVDMGLKSYRPFVSVGDSKNSDNLPIKTDDELREALRGMTGARGSQVPQADLVGKHRTLNEGHPVDLRIDINAFENFGTYAVTVHEHAGGKGVGKPIGFDSVVRLGGDVSFSSDENVATQIAMGIGKTPIATVKGKFTPSRDIPEDIDSWVPVGFDPKKAAYFYDKRTGQEVTGGVDAVSAGNSVFVRVASYGDRKAGKHYRNASFWGLESRDCGRDEDGRFGNDNDCAAGDVSGSESQKDSGSKPSGDQSEKDSGTQRASTREIVEEVLKSIEATGGYSVHPITAKSPTTGFMVATVQNAEETVNGTDEVTEQVVEAYFEKHKDYLSARPELHLGGWINLSDGKVYLDLSERFETAEEAKAASIEHKQIAYWDIVNKKEVRIDYGDDKRSAQADGEVRLRARCVAEGDRGCDPEGEGEVDEGVRGVAGEVRDIGEVRGLISEVLAVSGSLPKIEVRDIGKAIAFYSSAGDTIYVSPEARSLQDSVDSGWLSQKNPILHELAHRHHMLADVESYLAHRLFSPDERSLIESEVSRFAATNSVEFVAEALSGYWEGRQFGDGIRRLVSECTNGKVTL